MNVGDKMIPPLCYLTAALDQYICAVREMVYAIINRQRAGKDPQLIDAIQNGIVPLLQAMTDIERFLLRKWLYLLEHLPLDECEPVIQENTANRKRKIIELNRMLNQLCPNDEVIDELVEAMLQMEQQKKMIIQSLLQTKRNNDPTTVWLPVRNE